jgi:PEP-CTERM/exosortase A-associated glycosyltransferase
MKVLHLLDHSLPVQSGYAFRSDAILRALNARGVETVQLTSPKHPAAEAGAGLTYLRSPAIDGSGAWSQLRCVLGARRVLREVAAREKPDIIHAHSPCLNGIAAMGLGLPVVYEMRSSWEDAAVSSGKTTVGSVRYRASRWLETRTVRKADAVVVICDGLERDVLARGVQSSRITVVGNAIDPATLPPPTNEDIASVRRRYELGDRLVLGFFGSFFAWEGLDELVKAMPTILVGVPDATLLLAGGGEEDRRLRALVGQLGLDARVRFAGRVDHADIPALYGAADLMVFPRRRLRITEMVTPLKPLEAMHLGTIVLASDVGGHRELVRDGDTGYLFPADDPAALASLVLRVVAERSNWAAIRARARSFVETERTWSRMAERYEVLYRGLCSR